MKLLLVSALIPSLFLVPVATVATVATAEADAREADLRERVASLTHSTLVDGDGWTAYSDLMHPDLTRWNVSTEGVHDKAALTAMVKEWWEAGFRVGDSEAEILSLHVSEDIGIVRRRVREWYVGPDGGDAGSSASHVTQVWRQADDTWYLLAMDISPIAEESEEEGGDD